VKGILVDLDGVFYVGDQAIIPGSSAVIAWTQKNGVPHLFLTNTSSLPREAIVARLLTFGLSIDVDRILTRAVAATGIRAVVIGKAAQAFLAKAAHQRGKETADLPPWRKEHHR
jgi:ribonucleotide monophosphatase NagD (HAD superfamily)